MSLRNERDDHDHDCDDDGDDEVFRAVTVLRMLSAGACHGIALWYEIIATLDDHDDDNADGDARENVLSTYHDDDDDGDEDDDNEDDDAVRSHWRQVVHLVNRDGDGDAIMVRSGDELTVKLYVDASTGVTLSVY